MHSVVASLRLCALSVPYMGQVPYGFLLVPGQYPVLPNFKKLSLTNDEFKNKSSTYHNFPHPCHQHSRLSCHNARFEVHKNRHSQTH